MPAAASGVRRGRFIVFEGIDGSGKSSSLKSVADALRADGHDVVLTREETETPMGGWVKQAIAEHKDPLAVAFLFMADRAQHAQDLNAWLRSGKTVLCDRYVHSTLAYQSLTLQGVLPDPVGFLTKLHDGWCPMPDRVLLFKADPQKCVERTQRRGATAPYEKVDFLAKVQANYLKMAQGDPRFTVLEAERDIAQVMAEATEKVRRWVQ